MSAWLLKKKSGAAMVRMRQYNKRFFTIDFDARVFFYAHAENTKKVTSVIRFSDIVDVQLPDPGGNMQNMQRTESQQSTGSRPSLLRRSFSLRSNENAAPTAHHFVVVVVRPAKTMELLCSSQAEAEEWHQGFREAMLCGKEYSDDLSTNATGLDALSDGDAEGDGFRTVALTQPQSSSPQGAPVAGGPAVSSPSSPSKGGYSEPSRAPTAAAAGYGAAPAPQRRLPRQQHLCQ